MTAEPIPCPCGCEIPVSEADQDAAVTCPRCGRVIEPGENRKPIASILQRIQDINTNRLAVDEESSEDEEGLTSLAAELWGLCFPKKHISLWTWLRVAWIVCALHGILALAVLCVVLVQGLGAIPVPSPRQIPAVRDAFLALGKGGMGAAAFVMAVLAMWRVIWPRRLAFLERMFFFTMAGVSVVTLGVLGSGLRFETWQDHLIHRLCLFCATLVAAVAFHWAVKRRIRRYGARSRAKQ
jgi:hypothetical protein